MIKLVLFILFLLAGMAAIWFTPIASIWKILIDVWCALIIWIAVEMRLSPLMDPNDPNEPSKKATDDIEWGEVRP